MYGINHYLELAQLYKYWNFGCNMFTKDLLVSQLQLYYKNTYCEKLVIFEIIKQLELWDRIKNLIINNKNLLDNEENHNNIQKQIDQLTETIIRWIENRQIDKI